MSAQRIGTVDELEENKAYRVVLDGIPMAIVRDSAGAVHAIGDTCTHGDISLSEGFVDEGTIECWAHGSLFSLKTGAALTLPAYEPVPVFTVTVDAEGVVYVDPTQTLAV